MSSTSPIIRLASKSPRRRELLAQVGIAFELVVVDVPEIPLEGEAPADYVTRVARDKAEAGLKAIGEDALPVIGADTAVVVDGEIFGKPADLDEARYMLGRLSGRWHQVISVVALADTHQTNHRCQISQVCMIALDEPVIDAYWHTGEPRDKAGAYAIQGLASAFISSIKGSHSGIMGLPLFETLCLLRDSGVSGHDSLSAFLESSPLGRVEESLA